MPRLLTLATTQLLVIAHSLHATTSPSAQAKTVALAAPRPEFPTDLSDRGITGVAAIFVLHVDYNTGIVDAVTTEKHRRWASGFVCNQSVSSMEIQARHCPHGSYSSPVHFIRCELLGLTRRCSQRLRRRWFFHVQRSQCIQRACHLRFDSTRPSLTAVGA